MGMETTKSCQCLKQVQDSDAYPTDFILSHNGSYWWPPPTEQPNTRRLFGQSVFDNPVRNTVHRASVDGLAGEIFRSP